MSRSHKKYKKLLLSAIVLGILGKKIDVILVRSYFAINMRSARQLISHGHVKLNNSVMTSNSSLLKIGDKINFSDSIHSLLEYRLGSHRLWPLTPSYLQVSYKLFQIIVIEDSFNSNF